MNMLLLRNYSEKLMKAKDYLLPQNEGFVEFCMDIWTRNFR